MSITIEAIYEAGILKPLAPLPELADKSRVRVTTARFLQQNLL